MIGSGKRVRRTVCTVGALAAVACGAAGGAEGAQFHMNYGPNGTGGLVAPGSSYAASTSSFQLTTSTGAIVLKCDGASIAGATTNSTGGSTGTTSAGLSVTSGSFSACTLPPLGGMMATVAAGTSPQWLILPTDPPPAGTSLPYGPFKVTASSVKLNIACGSTTATYSGNLTTNSTFNDTNPGPQVQFTVASGLTKTAGAGCTALPATLYVNATYALPSMSDFWLRYD